MKTLVILMVLVFLPFSVSVDAGVKFETYNASDLSWDVSTDIDTTYLNLDYLTIDDVSDFVVWTADDVVTQRKLNHDTLREYVTGLDTVIILHQIECDTLFRFFYVADSFLSLPGYYTADLSNDTVWAKIEAITCDTIFRVEYRDVWASKVQVYLDSLQWQQLLRILEQAE